VGKATVRMVASGDGSLQLAPGYRYLWAHGIVTVLLLIALLAATWEFMGWVVAPSACLVDSSPPSACSPPAPASWGTTSPVVSRLVQADESSRRPGTTPVVRMRQGSAAPRPAPGVDTSAQRSPS
jgi:hypothetical protein